MKPMIVTDGEVSSPSVPHGAGGRNLRRHGRCIFILCLDVSLFAYFVRLVVSCIVVGCGLSVIAVTFQCNKI